MSAAQTARGFRLDIQGVRGLALIFVLLCHAEFGPASGGFVGLDIFFVLSGFLITGLIVEEIERTGTLSLMRFYGRRAKRLLPLAGTVLAVVTVATLVILPPVRGAEVSADVVASALYVVNWHFIAETVDYFAFRAHEVSPVQHYWSLSVEEQFYILWPLMLVLAFFITRRHGRRAMLLAVSAVGLASLVYGLKLTAVDMQKAYFSTPARGWELAVGSALALVLPAALRMPRALSALLAGAGLAALFVTTVTYDGGTTPYPGWRALIPTLATVAIIVAGSATQLSAPIRLLCCAPLQFLGKISYAWYLWHWPALTFALVLAGPLTTLQLFAVTLASGIAAVATHYAIEEPFRRSRTLGRRPLRGLAVGFACTAVAVFGGLMLTTVQPTIELAPPALAVGAAARSDEPQQTAPALRPEPKDAKGDRGRAWDDGCLVDKKITRPPECAYGDPSSDTTVILFGDSHAIQYAPAFIALAEERGWRLVVLARAACVMADVRFQPTCDAWRKNALARIRRERPDLIVTTNAVTPDSFRVKVGDDRLSRSASQPLLESGYARTLRTLRGTRAKVAVIRDQTRAPFVPADCAAEHVDQLQRCVFAFRRHAELDFVGRGARKVKSVRTIDPRLVLCPKRRCPSVIGNVIVYRDTYHLSATFARTLAPWLGEQLPTLRRAARSSNR